MQHITNCASATVVWLQNLKNHQPFGADAINIEYSKLVAEQSKAYKTYYDKISQEFEAKHLSGKDLVQWKYERYVKDYYDVAKSLDKNIGKILYYLDSTGLSKNTVVIYASIRDFIWANMAGLIKDLFTSNH